MTTKKIKKSEKDFPQGKKPSSGTKVEDLEDAIVDGMFTGTEGDELLVVRFRDGKKEQKSICIVKKIEGGEIHTWDDTRGQWYIFKADGVLKYGTVVKKIKKKALISPV